MTPIQYNIRDVIFVRCPACHAQVREPCISKDHATLHNFHAQRIKKYNTLLSQAQLERMGKASF